jgi:hypothetical protein
LENQNAKKAASFGRLLGFAIEILFQNFPETEPV